MICLTSYTMTCYLVLQSDSSNSRWCCASVFKKSGAQIVVSWFVHRKNCNICRNKFNAALSGGHHCIKLYYLQLSSSFYWICMSNLWHFGNLFFIVVVIFSHSRSVAFYQDLIMFFQSVWHLINAQPVPPK